MQRMMRFVSMLFAMLVSIGAPGVAGVSAAGPAADRTLTSFGSDRALAEFLARLTETQRREHLRARRESARRARTAP